MNRSPNVAIVGATGAVGLTLLSLLETRHFPLNSLHLLASPKSAGTQIKFRSNALNVKSLDAFSFRDIDLAFFAADNDIAKQFAPIAAAQGTIVIDKSSAFRLDSNVPLVIPEINAEVLTTHQGIIASPNCTTTIMLMAIAPLYKKKQIRRIIASTYQAASGAGIQAIRELKEESLAFLENRPYARSVFPQPYAFNVFAHNSKLYDNGYVDEELKILEESRKILGDASLRISATCVRVPTLRSHAETLNIEFSEPFSVEEAYDTLCKAPGLLKWEERVSGKFATPLDAQGKDEVLFGRIRQDLSHPNALEMWVVGDQILKGAALNAVQIAEYLIL
ncbi:MAG: aspartate-semialdehyde dehydrogenase [Simkania sp.]|nr:aspartate-semialdehyde dehydrogenase [Simkania sp.]